MSTSDLITEAIVLFHQLKQDVAPPQPGAIIAHPLDKYTYEVRSVDGDTITGFFIDQGGQEHTATFPLDEVFNPGTVMSLARQLQRGQIEEE